MDIKIIIDKLSGHDTKGVIGKIYKEVGASVKAQEVIFSIESGKSCIQYKAQKDGILQSLNIEEGDTVEKQQEVGLLKVDNTAAKTTSENSQKKAYSFGINKPAKKNIDCDVLVIGGGPGGYVAAIRAAQLGKQTVLIEKDKLGGTCLNYGCIPTKALVHSVETLKNIQEAANLGFKVNSVDIDFKQVISHKDEVVKTLVNGVSTLMKKHKITVIEGEAKVYDQQTITVKNQKLDATINYQKLIIATGATPFILPIPGSDLPGVLTSKETLALTKQPDSLVIIGGGIIGMEMAFIFNQLKTKVSVIEYLPHILANLDDDIIKEVKKAARIAGIKIYENAKATAIYQTADNTLVTEFATNDKKTLVTADKVLMGVGRKPALNGLDFKTLKVDLNEAENGIAVNEYMQTSNPNIYAIGDITNIIQLAHVASYQGITAAEHLAGINNPMNYQAIPSGVFTTPEIGTVGILAKEAKKLNLDVKVVKFPLAASGKAVAMNAKTGFVKLVVDKKQQTVIGGAVVGAHGTDLIATITQIIKDKITLEDAINTVYAHPTLSESIHEALLMADDRGIHFE